jgi:uncharacterized protein
MRAVRRTVPAPADLGTDVLGIPEGSDLDLELRLEAVTEGVLVSGTVRGRASGECVRCLADVVVDVDADLQELYVHADRAAAAADSGGHHSAADPDDDLRRLDGELIDLEPALRDVTVLALPFQPVCDPDCPGLCVTCGISLAADPEHHHDSLDPRWAALADLNGQHDQHRQHGQHRPD